MQIEAVTAQRLNRLLAFEGQEFLAQAYLLLLGRRIDPDGLRSYLSQLDRGVSKTGILYSIHVSREAIAHAGVQHLGVNRYLIELAFDETAGAESAAWVPALLRLEPLEFIKTAFHRIARRPPYTDELKSFSTEIVRGVPKLQILEGIVRVIKEKDAGSPSALAMEAAIAEWRAGLYPTAKTIDDLLKLEDVAFIDCAYKTFLKRPPDLDGLARYTSLYRSGVSKMWIVRKVRHSREGRQHHVFLPGLRRAAIRHRLSGIWMLGVWFSRDSDASFIESSPRPVRVLYRAVQRGLQMQRQDLIRESRYVEAVDSLLASDS